MGIICSFAAVSPEALKQFLDCPQSIKNYLFPGDGGESIPNSIDVNKAWHGIHYLLTGQSEPGEDMESLAVLGGQEFGPDLGNGPARFLLSSEVSAIAKALSEIPPESLTSRFDPKDMEAKDLYLSYVWIRDGEEALDFALHYYGRLQIFYRDAAARGDAVIQWLC